MNVLLAITLVVDASGHGNFTSIQAAINSLAQDSSAPRHILVKNGVYNEKVFIEKNNIVLEGEDREKTVLTFALARDAWRCEHESDWGVATLNLRGSDITLQNLTIQNTYGYDNKTSNTIRCSVDSQKTISREGHQMALRSFQTTRLKAINCIFKAYGGDTVSPWNVSAGMFYFQDCYMEGGVDFYCPRGWAWAEHCTFKADNGPACIWHDGSSDSDSKTVLKDCNFTGYDGFKLGRYHRDAQFYLIGCHFAANMADQDIYLVPTENVIRWGRRIYYYGCEKPGKPFSWYADNLSTAPGAPTARSITPAWVFHDKWDPTKN
ncbi:pectinesterase family protein [Puia sp.]|uniref:pectinesterase family protein n=1 Tax=Puia sp. TaxID=2045100 RepID=UPI002F3F349D